MDDSRIKSAREILSAFFDDERLGRAGRYAEFFASWKFLVGDQLAAHSRIADIDRHVLVVEAEHPGWIQLLQLRQSTILEGIGARFPEFGLRSIVFRLGAARPEPGGSGSPAAPPSAAAAEGTKTSPESLEEPVPAEQELEPFSLEDVADPELKKILSSLKKTFQG